MKTAVIIIGHDSDASLSLAARALSDGFDGVEVATFSDAATSISAAADRLEPGMECVVFPYTLELSTDQVRMLEDAIGEVGRDRDELNIRLAPPVGFDQRLLEIMEDRVAAALNESRSDHNVPILTVERQDGSINGLTIPDLLGLPDRLADIGSLVPDRRGEAVSVDAVLNAVGLDGTETKATFKSGEDFSADVDLEVAREKGWLVFWMEGRPLPARYGGPVRLLIPGIEDRCANVKSVDRLIVT